MRGDISKLPAFPAAANIMPAAYTVHESEGPPRAWWLAFAGLSHSDRSESNSGKYLDQVYAAGKSGAVSLDGQNIFIYRGCNDGILTCEFCVGAKAPFEPVGNVDAASDASGTRGDDHALGRPTPSFAKRNAAIHEWARAAGKKNREPIVGSLRTLRSDPAKCRTDIYYLLRRVSRDARASRDIRFYDLAHFRRFSNRRPQCLSISSSETSLAPAISLRPI